MTLRRWATLAAVPFLGGCAALTDLLQGIDDIFDGAPSVYLARTVPGNETRPNIFAIDRLRITEGRIPGGLVLDVSTTSYEAITNRIYVQRADTSIAPFGIADFSVRGDAAFAVAMIEEDIDRSPSGPEEYFAVFVGLPDGRRSSRVVDNVLVSQLINTCLDEAARPILEFELPFVTEEGAFDPEAPYDVTWSVRDTNGVGVYPFDFREWTETGDAAFGISLEAAGRVVQDGEPVRSFSGRDVYALAEPVLMVFTLSPETAEITSCDSGPREAAPPEGPYKLVPKKTGNLTTFDVERTGEALSPLLRFPATTLETDRFAVSGPVLVSRVIE